jgi:serine protease autotransporter
VLTKGVIDYFQGCSLMKLSKKPLAAIIFLLLAQMPARGGVMRYDIAIQDYRDFAENRGKYAPGAENIPVYRRTDGGLEGYLNAPMPDLGMVASLGYATIVAPSHVIGVRHNGGYKNITFGNNAKFAPTYKLINRNNAPTGDFHAPRLNKVMVDAAAIPVVTRAELKQGGTARYTAFARAGGGTQQQEAATGNTAVPVASAYKWKSGGMILSSAVSLDTMIRWKNYGAGSPHASPLSLSGLGGDSGSPVLAWDSVDKEWKVAGVLFATAGGSANNRQTIAHYVDSEFLQQVLANARDENVTDSATAGDIHWQDDAIKQGAKNWSWHGLTGSQATLAPSQATLDQLDATKDLRFNGEGGNIVLEQAVNMGAGKLQFSSDYTVRSTTQANATWAGGGVEVDKNKTVLWQVNGLKGDALHKIGAGTLYVNASGVNDGALNAGDGTVVLAQQAGDGNKKQAFSQVTLISGRPTVVLKDSEQIAPDNIRFGYRGGTLDVNGNSLTFKDIQHNDSGARIVNRNSEAAAKITLAGSDKTFLGTFGDKNTARNLSLTYAPQATNGNWTLRGGASLNTLAIEQGEFIVGGEQVKHAGMAYFSDDWLEKTYDIATVDVAGSATLTLKEHAALTGNTRIGKAATLTLWDRTALAGEVALQDSDSRLIADIQEHNSTMGETASHITANIYGDGKVEKTGSGLLTLSGNVDNAQGIDVAAGSLRMDGRMSSAMTLGKETVLSGNGRIASVTLADSATIAPGARASDSSGASTLRIGTLNAVNSATVALNSGFTQATTDRLLIDGDLNSAEDNPITLLINATGVWQDSDANQNSTADNMEGLSLIQVGGKASANSIKLANGYVARGAWAYGLYAFAPGHASAKARDVQGEGDQYWDYRLQNIMLNAEGISTPVAPTPEPAPEPTPSPAPAPEHKPEPTPAPAPEHKPEPTPAPTPEHKPEPSPAPAPEHKPEPSPAPAPEHKPEPTPAPKPEPAPIRKAVIPQVPAYISLPAMMLNVDQSIASLLTDSARDSRSHFFMSGYGGGDSYHASGSFTNYGYDFKTRYQGWVMGGRWQTDDESANRYALSLGVHKGSLSLKPDAADGASNGSFKTRGLIGILSWQHDNGLMADITLGYTRFKGDVATDLRGHVASPQAAVWRAGAETGKSWRWANHRFTPLAGIEFQHLEIDRFTDKDKASVRYAISHSPTFSVGIRHEWQSAPERIAGITLNNALRLRAVTGNAPETIVGSGAQRATFQSGKGGNQLTVKSGLDFAATENVSFNTHVKYQQRLEHEGISDWSVFGGINIRY